MGASYHDTKSKKMLDLSQPIYQTCPAWAPYAPVNINFEVHYAIGGYNAERIDMNTHTGTHVDAPFHFSPDGDTVEKLSLSKFTGRGVVIDLRDIGSIEILKTHLEAHEEKILNDDIVILYTGWAQKRGMNREYLYEWPYLSGEAARWLVEKRIKCVCIDGLSVGGWAEGKGGPPHEALLANDIAIVEELYMDDELLTEEEWFVVACPIKLQGCGGAPARVVAFAFE